MYSFAIADGWASDGLMAWTRASIEIDVALDAVTDAGAVLGALVVDTAWESRAVRILNEKLVDMRDRAGVESAGLLERAAELQRAGA
ncbi:MAG: hypothetical protein J7484_06080 [Microbacterium sp.]|nr:hypothetical protein [Microbacterium sp.]